ncbi:2-hydroxychromene-2-carboxylate isomerase [Tahibacter amnicola]|uniref:2-hydroxychromene-2-carboxylate isomerase n=1 Tax=Tahibacter amnicola TaxID=2976241 RepID=A0ABY6BH86_9GAMM|nr:2-hydroxychromene-2-carboxylate isomerase [Tahibacter amnicola]UXI69137.1 2-hydroxychromene-2-carboxylate isomerase [Tahibacter amnicola]
MQASWYFDFISPFAWLQLPKVVALRERVAIEPVPILFAAVLDRLGQLGPAEIPAKRRFTYRFVQWLAAQEGTLLRFPPAHPFNPLPALRLCVAAGGDWPAVEAIFRHIWQEGRDTDAASLQTVAGSLGVTDIAQALAAPAVKEAVRDNTERALAAGVFGVPTLLIGDEAFWGNDATAMAADYLARPETFATPEYARIDALPLGIERKRG